MNLMRASNQWASRPPDERFWTIQEMRDACRDYARNAVPVGVNTRTVSLQHDGQQDLVMSAPDLGTLKPRLTNWAFSQLCQRAKAPASFLRELPPNLAAQVLTDRLHSRVSVDESSQGRLLMHQVGNSWIARAITSPKYTRVWNWEVAEAMLGLGDEWRTPPARPCGNDDPRAREATEADCTNTNEGFWGAVRPGDMIAPAGIYASDHDMFCFMVNESVRMDEGGLAKGFFASNSEVGAASLRLTMFWYDGVCGNHIVWGARDVTDVRIFHIGNADKRFASEFVAELHRTAADIPIGDVETIEKAKQFRLGSDKEEVLEALFKLTVLPRNRLNEAWEWAEKEAERRSGVDPKTAWGQVCGITRMSQECQFTDDRVAMDRSAGKILDLMTQTA